MAPSLRRRIRAATIGGFALTLIGGFLAPAHAEDIGAGAGGEVVGSMTATRTAGHVDVAFTTDPAYSDAHLCLSTEPFTSRVNPGQCDKAHKISPPQLLGAAISAPAPAAFHVPVPNDDDPIYLQLHVVVDGETAYAGHQAGGPFYGNVLVCGVDQVPDGTGGCEAEVTDSGDEIPGEKPQNENPGGNENPGNGNPGNENPGNGNPGNNGGGNEGNPGEENCAPGLILTDEGCTPPGQHEPDEPTDPCPEGQVETEEGCVVPDNPTPDNPTPDNPTPDTPTPDTPAPETPQPETRNPVTPEPPVEEPVVEEPEVAGDVEVAPSEEDGEQMAAPAAPAEPVAPTVLDEVVTADIAVQPLPAATLPLTGGSTTTLLTIAGLALLGLGILLEVGTRNLRYVPRHLR